MEISNKNVKKNLCSSELCIQKTESKYDSSLRMKNAKICIIQQIGNIKVGSNTRWQYVKESILNAVPKDIMCLQTVKFDAKEEILGLSARMKKEK